MIPFPKQLIDRWQNRPDAHPKHGMVYWHVLLGDHPQVRATTRIARERLSKFGGLHMTPLKWLHITTLIAGSTDEVTHDEMREMLKRAALSLSRTPRITVSLGDVLYHPEAIALKVQPDNALSPIFEVAQSATRAVIGREGVTETGFQSWSPHVTLCYSTRRQAAGPIIAALGKNLPSCEVTIDALNLVVQRGPERFWDWHPVGEARLSDGTATVHGTR
jgi:2'-5' RNA ligase